MMEPHMLIKLYLSGVCVSITCGFHHINLLTILIEKLAVTPLRHFAFNLSPL